SGVMQLSVPRSSSGPHLPQLRQRAPVSRMTSLTASSNLLIGESGNLVMELVDWLDCSIELPDRTRPTTQSNYQFNHPLTRLSNYQIHELCVPSSVTPTVLRNRSLSKRSPRPEPVRVKWSSRPGPRASISQTS